MAKRRNRNYRNTNENSLLMMVGLASIGLALAFIVLFPNQFNNIKDLIHASGRSTQFPTTASLTLQGPNRGTFADGTQCYGEDNMANLTLYGYMQPGQAMTVDVPFCGWGNPGLMTRIDSPQTGVQLTVTDPLGNIYQPRDLGVINRNYVAMRCFWPPWGIGTGGVGGPVSVVKGGHWTVTLTNTNTTVAKNLIFQTAVQINYPSSQQECPKEDWTFIPPAIISSYANTTVSGIINITVSNSLDSQTQSPLLYQEMDILVQQVVKGGKNQFPYTTTLKSMADPNTNPPASFIVTWDTRTAPNGTYTLFPNNPSPYYYGGAGGIGGDLITLTVKN